MSTDYKPHVGRKMIRDADDVPGKIVRREGDRLIIEWEDGSEGFVSAALLEEADEKYARRGTAERQGKAKQAHVSPSCAEIIREMQNSATSLRDKAALGLAVVHGMSLGLDPSDPNFSSQIAALLKSGAYKEPPALVPLAPNRNASVRPLVEAISKARPSLGNAGSTIAVSYHHSGKGRD